MMDVREFVSQWDMKGRKVPARCPVCRKAIAEKDYIGMSVSMECANCREGSDLEMWDIRKYPETDWVVQMVEGGWASDEAVMYHATTRDDWYRGLPLDQPVHMGSVRSAMDRIKGLTPSGVVAGYTLYQLKLRKGYDLYDVCEDTNGGLDDELERRESIGDVLGYWNRFEGPGHVSFVTRKENFEVVGSERLTAVGW